MFKKLDPSPLEKALHSCPLTHTPRGHVTSTGLSYLGLPLVSCRWNWGAEGCLRGVLLPPPRGLGAGRGALIPREGGP